MIGKKRKILAWGGAFLCFVLIALVTYDFYENRQMRLVDTPIVEATEIEELSLDEYVAAPENFLVVDVREPEEFAQGHFVGALNIPLGELLAAEEKQRELVHRAGGRRILFFCYDGLRSRIAADAVTAVGAETVVFNRGHRQVRYGNVSDEIWTGSRTRVLPRDFRESLKDRDYDLRRLPDGVLLADLTWDQEYSRTDEKIIAAPLMRLPASSARSVVEKIGRRSFAALCNSRMSCFYAKILAYRVERNGGYFIGYYTRPLERSDVSDG